MKKNQKGFGAVEGLLILVIVGLIGFVGWYVWHSKNNANKALTNAGVSSSATITKTNPYAGWKQYCSNQEKSCFKYPLRWETKYIGAVDPSGDGIQLTSPAGTVLWFQSAVSGLGGACDISKDPHVFINKVIIEPSVTNLYVVETAGGANTDHSTIHIGLINGTSGQAPQTGDTGSCLYYTTFKSKHDPTMHTWFESNGSLNPADISAAELILKSYVYQ
jgi:hypothetical protein